MKNIPVKYQVLNITQIVSATAINVKFSVELLRTWKHLIGIAFVSRAGAGVDNYITISDNSKTIFDKAPLKMYTKSFRDISKDDIFLPLNIPAAGNIIEILLQGATVTTAYDIDVIFVLSNEPIDITEYNFQTKKITIPGATPVNTTLELAIIRLNSSFAEVKGFLINKDLGTNLKVAVKDAAGNYLLDSLDSRLLELDTTDFIPYNNTFFPVQFKSDQVVIIEVKLLTALIADFDVDCVFLLRKKTSK